MPILMHNGSILRWDRQKYVRKYNLTLILNQDFLMRKSDPHLELSFRNRELKSPRES